MNFMNQLISGGGNQGVYRQHGQRRQQEAQWQDMLTVMAAYEVDKTELEKSNKILLPSDFLQQTAQFGNLPQPMLFKIVNTYNNKSVYVGVLEFTAPSQHIVIPFWMFNEIECIQQQQVAVSLVTKYKRGNLVKIQPHETAFVDLPNPKAILENQLPKQYQFLTKGQTITIQNLKKEYKLDIVEVKPEDDSKTICIVDTDLNIDFAPPLDYVDEPQPLPEFIKKTSSQRQRDEEKDQIQSSKPFAGKGARIDGKQVTTKRKEQQMKQEIEKEYDPRKYRLKHGIRGGHDEQMFTSKAVKIGKSKQR